MNQIMNYDDLDEPEKVLLLTRTDLPICTCILMYFTPNGQKLAFVLSF